MAIQKIIFECKIQALIVAFSSLLICTSCEKLSEKAKTGLQVAVEPVFLTELGSIYTAVGDDYYKSSQAIEAQAAYQQALEYFQIIYNKVESGSNSQMLALTEMASLSSAIGNIFFFQNNYSKAEEVYRKSLDYYWEVYQKSADPELKLHARSAQAALWNSLGLIKRHLNQLDKAKQKYQNAQDICEETSNLGCFWRLDYNLSFLAYAAGDYETALQFFTKIGSYDIALYKIPAREIYEIIGQIYETKQLYYVALNYYVLAGASERIQSILEIYLKQGQYRKVTEINRLIDWIDTDPSNYSDYRDDLTEIGQNYQNQREYETALNYYVLAGDTGKMQEIAQVYENAGQRDRVEQIEHIIGLLSPYPVYGEASDESILLDSDRDESSSKDSSGNRERQGGDKG